MQYSPTYKDLADRDLEFAYKIKGQDMQAYSVRAVQQFVEKYMKHIIWYNTEHDFKGLLTTHNLPGLAKAVEIIVNEKYSKEDKMWFRALRSWYFDTTYPGDNYIEVTEEDEEELFEWLEGFAVKIRKQQKEQEQEQ